MPVRLFAALLALATALPACAGKREAPACSGPAFALNEGVRP